MGALGLFVGAALAQGVAPSAPSCPPGAFGCGPYDPKAAADWLCQAAQYLLPLFGASTIFRVISIYEDKMPAPVRAFVHVFALSFWKALQAVQPASSDGNPPAPPAAGGGNAAQAAKRVGAILLALALVGGAVTACVSQPVATTLQQAQAESQAILNALRASVAVYQAQPNANPLVVSQANAALAVAQQAVTDLTAAGSGNALTAANAVTQAVETVVAVLPIDPMTKAGIETGVAVIAAFVGNYAIQVQAPATSPTAARAYISVPGAPVPIPAPMPVQ
ncbi:MAG: hypothetical protein KGL26_03100 [Pseudomonadota bacterium]|nr:hypothetical protein [Pseudomonadota bacterium]